MSEIENYSAPESVKEAVQAISAGGTILAGGTDLMVQGGISETLVNIRRIPELGGVSLEGGTIRLGALCTVAEMMSNEVVAEHLPILAETADQFASPQIRNMATLGGNICNASPAGDMIPPLLALGAELELSSRRLPLDEFFTGPGATVLEPGELLLAIHVPKPGAGHMGGFRKFGPRPALEIATTSVAIAGELTKGVMNNVRVAFGAVAPTPIRGSKTEAVLEGGKLDAGIIAAAGQAANDEVSPITDTRASADYRRHLVRVLAGEILDHAAEN